MTEYCIQCMAPLGADGACAACGTSGIRASDSSVNAPDAPSAAPHCLSPGTVLADRYLIGRALGQGGFGITYIGRDLTLDMRVAIKEYFPAGYASRNAGTPQLAVQAHGDIGGIVQDGKRHFLEEARALAKFRGSPGIVDVLNYFEANGTAYIIMDYLDGETLKQRLSRGRLHPVEAFTLMRPVMDALEQVHAENVVHRDISPDNIMFQRDGTLCLMDFGAARVIDFSDQRTVSMVLKAGYAPEEQYRAKGELGPWTDIYALCATIYRSITGVSPDESLQRMFSDDMKWPSEMGVQIPGGLEAVLKKGMTPRHQDRYQSIAQMKAELSRFDVGPRVADAYEGRQGKQAGLDRQSSGLAPAELGRAPQAGTPARGEHPAEPVGTALRAACGGAAPQDQRGESNRRRRATVAAGVAAAVVVATLAAAAVFFLLLPPKATVSYALGGGETTTTQITQGDTLAAPEDPTREGYRLTGWFYDEACQQKADFPIQVEGDLTLYAGWELANADCTVQYLDRASKEPVAEAKAIEAAETGSTLTETAPDIDGYELDGDKEQSLAVSADANQNSLAFYYRKIVGYQVDYLNQYTGNSVRDSKKVDDKLQGDKVTEEAPNVQGYTLASKNTQALELTSSTKKNRITFYYTRNASSSGASGSSGSASKSKKSSSSSKKSSSKKKSNDVTWAN